MTKYEKQYVDLVKDILANGQHQEGRNGGTTSLFAKHLNFDLANGFPLLQGRRMYIKGILGEFAAFLEGPKCLADFEKHDCNYWYKWADDDGELNIDYGNAWLDFNGVNQIAELIEKLRVSPDDRRLLITGWNPENLGQLSLPCCHYAYQFYIRRENGKEYIDIAWHQRSTDTMIGAPSDVVLAACWLIALGDKLGFIPGRGTLTLGNTHIYDEHVKQAEEYCSRAKTMPGETIEFTYSPVMYPLEEYRKLCFKPSNLSLAFYEPLEPIKFELKA